MAAKRYPPEAYAKEGVLWWDTDTGKRGAERRLAAWLFFNMDEGDTFTMPQLRDALGSRDAPEKAEHLNRRLRRLRDFGWIIPSNKDDRTLPPGTYRLVLKGWHPGIGPRPRKGDAVSQGTRRRVLERDGRRCVVCGVGSGEPYPGEPGTRAVLTIGHRIPQAAGGSSTDLNNLQVECKRCNEPVRGDLGKPEQLDDLYIDVRALPTKDLESLLMWLSQGHRGRSKLDVIFDRARMLSVGERQELQTRLVTMLGRGPSVS